MNAERNGTRPLVVLGTRPEAIKLSPVIRELRSRVGIEPIVCHTGQHRELADDVLGHFGIVPDIDLDLMRPGQTLGQLTARAIARIDRVIRETRPTCVVVQGDTTSVFAASVAAFYEQIPIFHVEAGLRTRDVSSPFPEEFNRRVATLASTYHCAPTELAAENLRREGVPEDRIRVTGNTGIDALLETARGEAVDPSGPRSVLVTVHRRENLGEPLSRICVAIRILATKFPDVRFVFPVHPRPEILETVIKWLGGCDNIEICQPMTYKCFVRQLIHSTAVLTDSGGVQEEAVTLGCDLLILRESTERSEAVSAALAELIGTRAERIVSAVANSLANPVANLRSTAFGDGQASKRITYWIDTVRQSNQFEHRIATYRVTHRKLERRGSASTRGRRCDA